MLQEIQLIPYGLHTNTSQVNFLLDDAALALTLEASAQENDFVVDYEHQTLKGGTAPAAGWIKRLINRGAQGLWGLVEWTDQARRFIAAKEYRYLSPVFLRRESDGRVVKFFNAALTNFPAIDGMVPLVNKAASGICVCSFKLGDEVPFVDEQRRSDEHVRQQMGVSEEVWRKYGG